MSQVLAVDDEQDILYTLEAIGDVAEFDIATESNGFRALELLKKGEYELIMVDYYMPEINGLNLVKEIREIDQDIPILVLTVDESVELADKFLKAGATDFATKPIKTADLISRVNLHLKLTELSVEDGNKAQRCPDLSEMYIPKGMSLKTLKLIVNYLQKQTSSETIDEISDGTGLAYQTVHRYMNFLADENHVNLEMDYGKVGRPIHRYSF